MNTQILLAHIAPHLHGGGLLVLVLLVALAVAIALVCRGSSKN